MAAMSNDVMTEKQLYTQPSQAEPERLRSTVEKREELSDVDDAFDYVQNNGVFEPSPLVNRRLLRKIDWCLMPLVW